VFSISGTASGQLYAAFLPEAVARPLYEAERTARRRAGATAGSAASAGAADMAEAGVLPTWARFAADTLAEVRRQGLGRADGAVVAGVSALSAPVFDPAGAIVLALTVIGPSAALDSRWDGPLAGVMRDAAAAVSARLGFRAAVA
jgi:DNA-binding IclR family transcriptional regulator